MPHLTWAATIQHQNGLVKRFREQQLGMLSVNSSGQVRKRARLRDVAARAGVSPTTASFVLNNRDDIKLSVETRERVRAAATALEYRPNNVARSLSRGRSMLVGLLVADLNNPYNWQVASTMDRIGFAAGYSMVIFDAQRKQNTAHERIERMLGLDLDGVLVTHPSDIADFLDAQTRRNVSRSIPAVCCGGTLEVTTKSLLPGCYVDGIQTSYIATQHLIAHGHRRIAFMADHLPYSLEWDHAFVRGRPRYRGYVQALTEAGITEDPALLCAVRSPDDVVSTVLKECLELPSPPTAILAYNDMAAFGAYRILEALGRRIPRDISIVGVDDIGLAAQMSPPLTTMSQRMDDATDIAMHMLLRMIAEPGYPGTIVTLDPTLVTRASVASRTTIPA